MKLSWSERLIDEVGTSTFTGYADMHDRLVKNSTTTSLLSADCNISAVEVFWMIHQRSAPMQILWATENSHESSGRYRSIYSYYYIYDNVVLSLAPKGKLGIDLGFALGFRDGGLTADERHKQAVRVMVYTIQCSAQNSNGMTSYHGPSIIVVKGAGQSAVNGVYVRDCEFEGASKFSRQGEFDGEQCIFSVFRCSVSNNTKHWYISIVPTGRIPGTRHDRDFYSVPVTDTCLEVPPEGGWALSNDGLRPPPTLLVDGPNNIIVKGAGQSSVNGNVRDGELEGASKFSQGECEQCIFSGPSKIVVKGAGQSAVNGVYVRDGEFEGASKFSRLGEFDGELCIFSIFQCFVSNNTKHWNISIVPTRCIPGTRDDTDFYSALVTDTCL